MLHALIVGAEVVGVLAALAVLVIGILAYAILNSGGNPFE